MIRVDAFDFYGRRRSWFGLSLLLIVTGAVLLVLPGFGLRLGIDFVGGSILEARFERADIATAEVRAALIPLGFGEPIVQKAVEDPHRFLIRTRVFDDEQRLLVEQALTAGFGPFAVERFEGIAGVIGQELSRKAVLAVAVAAALMLLYITIRFEFRFAVAAIIALFHDVAITVAAFSLLQREVNSSFVAAILTVVGYSINDTIVLFDRIRENLRLRPYRARESGELINQSIRQTLTRSVNTSLTTLLAVGAVLVFGGRTTRDFAAALMIGVATGTYSSIFIASPIWAMWRERAGQTAVSSTADAGQVALEPAVAPAPGGAVSSTAAARRTGGRKRRRR